MKYLPLLLILTSCVSKNTIDVGDCLQHNIITNEKAVVLDALSGQYMIIRQDQKYLLSSNYIYNNYHIVGCDD